MGDQEQDFLKEIKQQYNRLIEVYDKREKQFKRIRGWFVAGLIGMAAVVVSLGYYQIRTVAVNTTEINNLKKEQLLLNEKWQHSTPWEIYVHFTEYWSLQYEAMISLYQGSFPERFPEFYRKMEDLRKYIMQARETNIRGSTESSDKD
jgi:hypothetical protein